MPKNKLIDIDAEFDDFEFDEAAIEMATRIAKRNDNGWYEKNNARLNDPEYVAKLAKSLQESAAVKAAGKIRANDPMWIKNQKEGCQQYINSPDFVPSYGMLGKKRSDESKAKGSQSLKGLVKPLEGNKKISEWRKKNFKPTAESIEKSASKIRGVPTDKNRPVKTPAGRFDRIRDAAEYYGVSTGTIKNFCNKIRTKDHMKPRLIEKGVKFNKDGIIIGFSFVNSVDIDMSGKKVKTPDGIFENVKAAAEFYNISTPAIRYRIKHQDAYSFVAKTKKK